MAKAKGSVASRMLTAGSYEYVIAPGKGMTLQVGRNDIDQYAASGETLLSWVRFGYQWAIHTDTRAITAICTKQEANETSPDPTDSDTIEKLRRDGKLFFLKHFLCADVNYSGRIQKFETEFRNVKLRTGERLVWSLWNHGTTLTSGWDDLEVMEYRKVTV